MPIDSAARICRSMMHSSSSRASSACQVSSLHQHSRKLSQYTENEGPSSHSRRPRPPHSRDPTLPTPDTLSSNDAITHLRKTFPPLEFPPEVAQRMTTHISWNRGIDGHNGRLGFVGRRVLHTYLLLFLHECSLPPQGHTFPKNATVPPSFSLRNSVLGAGKPFEAPPESYDDVSEKLLNTYVLGEHVGAAWKLERIMRWTPAIAELDTVRAEAPNKVLHSSGLYKVRGTTVEGVVGGIFHQFGGAIAHRVFHTRVLPHIYHLGLPVALRTRAEEACERLGGHDGLLIQPSSRRERTPESVHGRRPDSQGTRPVDDHLKGPACDGPMNADFTKVNAKQWSRERQRMGYVG